MGYGLPICIQHLDVQLQHRTPHITVHQSPTHTDFRPILTHGRQIDINARRGIVGKADVLLCSTDEPHIAVDAAKDGEVAGQRRYPVVLIIDVHHQQIRGIGPYFIRNVYGKGRVTSFVGSEQLAVEVHICQRIDSIKFQVKLLIPHLRGIRTELFLIPGRSPAVVTGRIGIRIPGMWQMYLFPTFLMTSHFLEPIVIIRNIIPAVIETLNHPPGIDNRVHGGQTQY